MIAYRLTGSRCRCQACGELFNSTTAFTRHRVGPWTDRGAWRRCLVRAEMVQMGWAYNAAGFWITETRVARLGRSARNGDRLEADHHLPGCA
jgi:hypothetical protein